MSECNCNSNGRNATHHICGEFEEPNNPDDGCCFPYRVKQNCEAPDIPEPECGDEIEVEHDPDDVLTPFKVWSTLYDQNCSAILDENDSAIRTLAA